ncbi:hypothetical protein HNQ95_006078 [Aminobacter ciceronei]|uniref:Uncharacterized protein n=1 Tax=Aminobacter ciceronei TaxID=150723 RepID=A0ABR6CI06_9HYPH|nr:hypothetical protein [Aminobacter ciceronei]MBA9023997.1 hypothetical protein [Aminobacter ciceronei]
MTPTAGTVDHLETPKLPLRVKRKVKSRHKPISDPNTGSATSQIAITPERWLGNTAYAMTAERDWATATNLIPYLLVMSSMS